MDMHLLVVTNGHCLIAANFEQFVIVWHVRESLYLTSAQLMLVSWDCIVVYEKRKRRAFARVRLRCHTSESIVAIHSDPTSSKLRLPIDPTTAWIFHLREIARCHFHRPSNTPLRLWHSPQSR